MSAARILAIDAGTSSVRTLAVTDDGEITAIGQREFTQHYPQPGWVEHDAAEIWDSVAATLAEVLAHPDVDASAITAIGITNQRETVVAWDRRTGEPLARAIVWQDRRTTRRCEDLRAEGAAEEIRRSTGLVCDPYFSATKMEWLLANGVDAGPDLAFGTIDSWLTYKLTGGAVHVTDASNASRTMLFGLASGDWSDPLCARFGVPRSSLPEVVDSSGVVGTTDPDAAAGLAVAVAGMAGDQQSSLFGQACFAEGMTKNTYGTGSFVLTNAGPVVPPVTDELLATVAWRLGGVQTFALEGSIFVTGAAVKWMRDQMGLVESSAEIGPLAESVADAGGVVLVPAFAGLGAPYWNPHARAAVFGLTRGITKAHLARAAVESMALQTRDVIAATERTLGEAVRELRVDGGASVMDVLCQVQADQLGCEVVRTAQRETTALGAAFLAGIATGVWSGIEDAATTWRAGRNFSPAQDRGPADTLYATWQRAVSRVQDYGTASTAS